MTPEQALAIAQEEIALIRQGSHWYVRQYIVGDDGVTTIYTRYDDLAVARDFIFAARTTRAAMKLLGYDDPHIGWHAISLPGSPAKRLNAILKEYKYDPNE